MKTQSQQFLKRRKFLLVLPILVLPFAALAFLALGGGPGPKEEAISQQGLNTRLPDAKISDDPSDKMSIYNKADKDSMDKTHDLFGRDTMAGFGRDSSLHNSAYPPGTYPAGSGGISPYQDPNEIRVQDRLARLEEALNRPTPPPTVAAYPQSATGSNSPGIDRLEQIMQAMNSKGAADPETQQLNELMDKLMDLQYPGRAQQKLKEQSMKNKGRVYSVSATSGQKEVPVLQGSETATASGQDKSLESSNGFYDISSGTASDTGQTAIPAVVHETQTLVSGATLKMRLSEDILINGTVIPAGNFVYGTCTVNGERLKVDITSIRYGKNLYPVSMGVYDLDALEGIRIPGAITRDAVKEGSDRALQGVQLMSLDPSIGAQAAGAGVEMAKGLFSKKIKLVRVTVKAGYPVLLMDAKARQQLLN